MLGTYTLFPLLNHPLDTKTPGNGNDWTYPMNPATLSGYQALFAHGTQAAVPMGVF
jgi:hypothetical protein